MQLSGTRFDGNMLVFDDASFPERVPVSGHARSVSCTNTRFLGGGDLRLPRAEIVLDGTDFSRPSTLSGARVTSLRQATVADLTLASVDLSTCHFSDARGLDQMHLEGDVAFAWSPGG